MGFLRVMGVGSNVSRLGRPFQPIDSSAPGFLVNVSSTASLTALESSDRFWSGPSNRAMRIACSTADDFFMAIGASGIAAASSVSQLLLGGTVENFYVGAQHTYVSFIAATSTALVVNVTLGYGY